jgi:two-component system, OmpR family, response regulator BaeR
LGRISEALLKAKILIVEDEQKLASLLARYLDNEGYAYCMEGDGAKVLTVFDAENPQLVLLDINLPNVDGLQLCNAIRERGNVPIIMTTARIDEIDRLIGLDAGADDYICKPYSPREVVARVRAVLRRASPDPQHSAQAVDFDEARLQVQMSDKVVVLTAIEFKLLHYLARSPGRIYSRERLMDVIYEDHRVVADRTIDSHIKKLRAKLKAVWPEQEIVHSVYGAGYKFEV